MFHTLPPATYELLMQTPLQSVTVDRDVDAARAALARLAEFGIDLAAATDQLENEGVASFSDAFHHLLGRLDGRRGALETVG